jgi:hypothetical protein
MATSRKKAAPRKNAAPQKKPTAQQKGKWTTSQINEHIDKIQAAIKAHKNELTGEHFTAVTPEDIQKKFERTNSPMIIYQSWSGAPAGGTASYQVGIYNPDPTQAIWLFVHVWVGSGNVDPTVGTFLLNVDERFPRLTEPATTGLTLAPGASTTLNFALNVPAGVQKTNYIGNSCLMQFNWQDVGTYLDRGVFVFAVT